MCDGVWVAMVSQHAGHYSGVVVRKRGWPQWGHVRPDGEGAVEAYAVAGSAEKSKRSKKVQPMASASCFTRTTLGGKLQMSCMVVTDTPSFSASCPYEKPLARTTLLAMYQS